jgi:diguanylate cyclase (GGDEF)-like protein
MKLHPLTLKFTGESSKFEAPFLSDYSRVSIRHIRISLILGAVVYAAFGILDAILMSEQKYTMWLIRFVIVCPVLFGTLLASFSKSFERYMQPILAVAYILAGGGIICMIVIAPIPINYSYYAGLMLVFTWGYTFIRIRFLWASLAGWVQVVLYEIVAIWIRPTPFTILLGNNFFFISANIIGMLACYSIEFYARRDYFLTQQLEIEREKINQVNQELEERVEKRTADYQIINRALEQEIVSHKKAESQREAALKALRESEQKYRDLSIIDDLTQLYNSRHFYAQLEREIERSNRYEQPLTLLLLDLDKFKEFNDIYGHVEGDYVLSRLGQVVKRCLRETDSAYRYGGEEFTIMLPMTTSEEGMVTAKRIQVELRKETFSPVLDQKIYMTVSIGLAHYKPKEEMKAFVQRVDQLMYQAKKNGRDRICPES